MPNNATKRASEGSSGSKTPDETYSGITLKSIMEKLAGVHSRVSIFELCRSYEINNLRADVNARLSIFKNAIDDLRTSLDAAWVEIEAFKQLDEQNKLQLAKLAKENAQLQLS